jgi:hypothetical protein
MFTLRFIQLSSNLVLARLEEAGNVLHTKLFTRERALAMVEWVKNYPEYSVIW